MALAAQVLLSLGIILAYLCRPADPLLRWLAAMTALSFLLATMYVAGFRSQLQVLLPYAMALLPLLGLFALGAAFALAGIRLLPSLAFAARAASSAAVVLVAGSGNQSRLVLAVFEVGSVIAAFVAATAVLVWHSLRRGTIDARLMLAPHSGESGERR